MHHRAVVVAVFLCLYPAVVRAQAPAAFRVEADSASVHLSPSTGSRVIGRARRGQVLEVTRELGSWVKVSWPDADDGAGYVHVSTGSRTGVPAAGVSPAGFAPAHRAAAMAASPANNERAGDPAGERAARSMQPVYVAPPAHVVGVGARLGGPSLGSGASVRAWLPRRLGFQFEVSRSSLDGATAPDRLTAIQFGPSVLYSLPERVTDYVWVRPYLGAGPRFMRQTLHTGVQPGASASELRTGFETFGGAELTFASVPSLAVSAGLHYGWLRDETPGFDLGGVGVSIAAHWYVK